MDKFGRNYELTVQKSDGKPLTVKLPFTIEFDITRNTLTSANVCQFRIYNLNENNRSQLRFNVSNYGEYRPVIFKAGYGDDIRVVFKGNISQAWSFREGVNFITQIECYDGGFAFNNGQVDLSVTPGATEQSVIRSMVNQGLPNVEVGAIGKFLDPVKKGNTHSGNTAKTLGEITGGAFFIDNEKAYALKTNEYVADSAPLRINAGTGILGTPLLEQYIARFDMLFEPGLEIGRAVLIDSVTEKSFNGLAKITSVKHRGTISEVVCGNVTTTGEFFFFTSTPEPVR